MPWDGPPNNMLGVVLPLNLVLARSARAVVTLGALTVYPSGFEFDYLVRSRDEELGQLLPEHLHRARARGASSDLPAELFRFGIEFADGARVTSLQPTLPFAGPDSPGPVMVPRGGGGSFDRWLGHWWVWPLPPPGRLAFVCEWPAAEIGLARVEIDADAVRDAADRAEMLWEGDSEVAGSASIASGYSAQVLLRKIEPPDEEPGS
jgi:hypothetical protein